MSQLLTSLTHRLIRLRHDPLRRYIYLLLWPWFVPVVGYLIFGPELFGDWKSFLSGMAILLVLCTVANEADTAALLRIIKRYPALQQSLWRIGWMIVTFTLVNLLLAELSLRGFAATRFLNYTYQPDTNVWVMSFVFISSVVAAGLIESAYAYMQWQTTQTDTQRLERENLAIRLNDLKSRINPHFLFNSLNSVSSLITDEPQRAEQFVDEMAKVYRYLLQAHKTPLVSVAAETQFLHSYARLLDARYGPALQITCTIDPLFGTYLMPPVSVQILIDDIIQHNTLTTSRPLQITLTTEPGGTLLLSHNRQARTLLVNRQLPSIADIVARYHSLCSETVHVEAIGNRGEIKLPLLPPDTILPLFSPADP